MACTIGLFTVHNDNNGGTVQTGGAWTITNSSIGFPVTIDGVIYNQDDPVGTGGNPSIDFTGTPAGTYEFTYLVGLGGGCAGEGVLSVTVEDVPVGQTLSVDKCEGSGNFILNDEFAPPLPTGGSWTVVPLPPFGVIDLANPLGGVYGPAVGDGSPTGVTYVFTYEYVQPDTHPDCDNCTISSTLNVTVYSGGPAGNPTQITVCA